MSNASESGAPYRPRIGSKVIVADPRYGDERGIVMNYGVDGSIRVEGRTVNQVCVLLWQIAEAQIDKYIRPC